LRLALEPAVQPKNSIRRPVACPCLNSLALATAPAPPPGSAGPDARVEARNPPADRGISAPAFGVAARTERPPFPTCVAHVPPEVDVLSSSPVPFEARRTGPPADTPDARRSPLDRFLNLFTDVRSGESITALLLMLDIFVILAAYYLLKTIREPLIINRKGGAEMKSYSAAAIAGILVFLVRSPAPWLRAYRASA